MIEFSLTLDDESNGAKEKAPASHETSRPLTVRYHGQGESNNISYRIRRNSKKLGLKVLVPKTSDNGRGKERQRRDADADAQVCYVVHIQPDFFESRLCVFPVELCATVEC